MSSAIAKEFIPYNIAQLPGVQLWLDAADSSSLTLSGNTVTAWRDKSGLANNATINNSVTFNAADKSVRTDGTSGYFTSPLDTRKTTSTYYNVFLVYKWLSSSSNTNQSLWGNDVGGGWNRFQLLSFPSATSIAYGLSRGATSPNTTNISALNTSNTLLYSANYAYNITNGSYAYVNGSQAINFTEVAASPETSTQLIFFGQLGSDQYFASIAFYEIIVARLEISTQTRQVIEGYLAWKWGLQGSLPNTHPYYSSPFYAFPPFPLANRVKATNVIVNRPSILSSAVMWIDAARDSTASGSYVNSITDRGTGGYTISAVSNNTITMVRYGLNGLPYYNLGANRLKVTSLNWRTKFVCFFVFKANNGNFLYSQQPGGIYKQYLYSGNWGLIFINETFGANDSVLAQGTSVTGSSWCIFTIGYNNGTTVSPYNVNGTARTSQTGTSTGDTNLINDTFINGNSSTTFDTTQLAEIIHFNTNLSSSEVSQVEGYLAWKWGLQGLLPSSHAYKSYPFYQATPFPVVPAVTRSIVKSFDPTKLTGCQLWLDASSFTGLTNGQAISTWVDKSANALTGTAVNSPTYQTNVLNKLPVIRFNGTNQYISFGNVLNLGTNGLSIFVITKFDTTNECGIVGKTAYTGANGRWALWYGKNGVGAGVTGVQNIIEDSAVSPNFPLVSTNPSNAGTQFNMYTFQSSRLVSNMLLNGSLQQTATGTGTPGNLSTSYNMFVGAYPDSGGTTPRATMYLNGDIAEIIVYFASLSDVQRMSVDGYLAWKWGLQSSLPQTHPWKLFPPPPN